MTRLACFVLPLVVLMTLTACASQVEGPGPERSGMPDPANRMSPDTAPTPFSAAEIRMGCPAGRRMRTEILEPGKDPVFQVTEFLGGDSGFAQMRGWLEDASGKRTPERPQPMQAKWTELQSHAAFPAIFTTITEESVEVPAGRFDCWHYKIEREREGKIYGLHFWFAKEFPGPPIKQLRVLDGKAIQTVRLVENETP